MSGSGPRILLLYFAVGSLGVQNQVATQVLHGFNVGFEKRYGRSCPRILYQSGFCALRLVLPHLAYVVLAKEIMSVKCF